MFLFCVLATKVSSITENNENFYKKFEEKRTFKRQVTSFDSLGTTDEILDQITQMQDTISKLERDIEGKTQNHQNLSKQILENKQALEQSRSEVISLKSKLELCNRECEINFEIL